MVNRKIFYLSGNLKNTLSIKRICLIFQRAIRYDIKNTLFVNLSAFHLCFIVKLTVYKCSVCAIYCKIKIVKKKLFNGKYFFTFSYCRAEFVIQTLALYPTQLCTST